MKNVLLLTLDFPPTFIGGISAWSSDLADALHQAGHSVTVIAKKDGDTTKYDKEKPYTIIRAKGRSWAQWQHLWMRLASGKHIGEDTLVVAATWPLVGAILPLIRRRKAQLAIAFHGSEITTLHAPTKTFVRILEAATLLLPVSNFLRTELIRLGCDSEDDRLRVLPMPLHVSLPKNDRKRQNLICVARPTSRKGIERAIKIAELIMVIQIKRFFLIIFIYQKLT